MLLHKDILINESGEELEIVNSSEFVVEAMYYKWEYTDIDTIKLRSGVIERLRKAKEILNNVNRNFKGWNIKIWDGYRTLRVQKALYDNYFKELKAKHPDWTEKIIKKNVEIFICPPSYDPKVPSPHNTGGAVDLTLVDEKGNEVLMGTPFDEFTERSFTNHFEKSKESSEIKFHKNRLLLKEILEEVEFMNYPEEWWHFNYGNPQWAHAKGLKAAIYGSAEL